jgi:glutamate-ammonia-ligase adenylyltransferase
MSERLIANPDWISEVFDIEKLKYKRGNESLRYDVYQHISSLIEARDYSRALSTVRIFKQKEMLRIAVRDLSGLGSIEDILEEISNLADVCLDSVYEILWLQLTERYGAPYHKDFSGKWNPTGFSVIGLGKLGGKELNYSSDIDVIFVYTDEGKVFSKPPDSATDSRMSNHQFFTLLAEAFVSEVSNSAPEGRLYRIDLRLRPEGKAGALVRSLDSYENFYAQYGQTWERMMLIKARGVAGDQQLANEFIETVQPFRFPRSVSGRVLDVIAEMKERIENEVVKSGELNRNIKLGRGGIREIEFIVQMHQLIYGGKIPFIQEANTLACLEKLSMYDILPQEEPTPLKKHIAF